MPLLQPSPPPPTTILPPFPCNGGAVAAVPAAASASGQTMLLLLQAAAISSFDVDNHHSASAPSCDVPSSHVIFRSTRHFCLQLRWRRWRCLACARASGSQQLLPAFMDYLPKMHKYANEYETEADCPHMYLRASKQNRPTGPFKQR